jgi:hypothetical protein
MQAPIHGVIPEKQAMLLGQVDLPIMFDDETNFRTETLMFEVVDFAGTYHAILGQLCYAKFMAIPTLSCITFIRR